MLVHYFFIRSNGRYIRIDIRTIRYAESMKNYVRIHTTERMYLALLTMAQLERELPADQFCRIHRSYLVGLAYVTAFDHETVCLGETVLPFRRLARTDFLAKVRILVCENRDMPQLIASTGEKAKDE